jgi:hypothetical protein
MKTRFDLEQEILHCWNVVDDVNLINEAILERDLTKDEIANLLTGIHSLYQLKFQTLFETFEDCCKNKTI